MAGTDGAQTARLARLRYVSDGEPGLTRQSRHGALAYCDQKGREVRDEATLARIKALVIPPAWTDVWICPRSDGHLQATGRDARGRKQYRYHPRWSTLRDAEKFDRILEFARALPLLRRRLDADLRQPPLSRRRVLAVVVRLLEVTLIRVGNDEYARVNGSYGLTTMLDRHVEVTSTRVVFRFRAKSGVRQQIDLHDPELARSVRRCRDLPGQRLFQYLDEDGRRQSIESGDVNAYLRELTGRDFTAKDFRTWSATVLAVCALRAFAHEQTAKARKAAVVKATDAVAGKLGNTRAVCRKAYIHPVVLDTFMSGAPLPQAGGATVVGETGSHAPALSSDERAVLTFLRAMRARSATRPAVRPGVRPPPVRMSDTGTAHA